MTSHSEFDDKRTAEFLGGPWDGHLFTPTVDGDLPEFLPMPWRGEVYGYWLVEPVSQAAFFECRGKVVTHGSEVW
jgi:hypothetical protein